VRADQSALIAQIVSLHLAMVAGIFFFLHRAGMRMKLAVFLLYSLGYALFLGLIWQSSLIVAGARHDLIQLASSGQRLSGTGYAAFREIGPSFVNVVSIIATTVFLALWGGTVYFLFFWKRPEEAE
jgi:hypothetical protein